MGSQCEVETLPAEVLDAPRKKSKLSVNDRQWSVDPDTCKDPITHYTIKVYYRDPEEKLPSCIRQSRKEDIIDRLVTYEGFRREECVGTKDQLLNKLQRCRPFVTFKIDGREGIQRVLSTALRQFGWSCCHMFNAKLPRRGSSTIACGNYQGTVFPFFPELTMSGITVSRNYIVRRPNRTKSLVDKAFPHLLQWQRDEMFEGIMDFTINLFDMAPRRSFIGCAFESVIAVDDDEIFDERDMEKVFLSLNDLSLLKGDRIHYEYDFGDTSIFIAEIVKCEENQSLIPEMFADDRRAAVRATVLEESTNKIPRQYR